MSDKIAAEWAKGFPAIVSGQKAIQSGHGFIYKRLGDTLSSKVAPLGLTLLASAVLAKGLFHLYTGTGKKE